MCRDKRTVGYRNITLASSEGTKSALNIVQNVQKGHAIGRHTTWSKAHLHLQRVETLAKELLNVRMGIAQHLEDLHRNLDLSKRSLDLCSRAPQLEEAICKARISVQTEVTDTLSKHAHPPDDAGRQSSICIFYNEPDARLAVQGDPDEDVNLDKHLLSLDGKDGRSLLVLLSSKPSKT